MTMKEHPRPFCSMPGVYYRWWYRDIGPYGPWSSEFSFNRGRTWHRFVSHALFEAAKANELEHAPAPIAE